MTDETNRPSNPLCDLAWQTYLHNWAPLSSREYDVARGAFIAAWHAGRGAPETNAELPVGYGVFLYNGRLLEVVHTEGDREFQASLGGREVKPLYTTPQEPVLHRQKRLVEQESSEKANATPPESYAKFCHQHGFYPADLKCPDCNPVSES